MLPTAIPTSFSICLPARNCWSQWKRCCCPSIGNGCFHLDLRNIKTTLGMERLSCRTSVMVQKEIWVYLLAYNLIRLLMAQSAILAEVLPRQQSFKHTLQIWIAWRQSVTGTDDDKLAGLFILIAQQHVGNRPGRLEPRAVKRRPKPFPLLTKPRPIAREEIQLYGRPKKLK